MPSSVAASEDIEGTLREPGSSGQPCVATRAVAVVRYGALVIALVDESIVPLGQGGYVLACVVIPDQNKSAIRRRVRRISPSGHRQFHWTTEEERERWAMVRVLSEEATSLIAHVRRPCTRGVHEVARAELLRALLGGLRDADVLDLVIESRQAHNDHRDRHMIAEAQRRGDANRDLSYGHADPRQEPLLWLADALAGAVAADVRKRGNYISSLPEGLLVLRRTTGR